MSPKRDRQPVDAAAVSGGGVDPVAPIVARAHYMMGDNVDDWSPSHAAAWEGLLEVAARLRRAAEGRLAAHGDFSVSMLGVMGRLLTAERRTLRQTALADAMGLSMSRVSRIIDVLERRRLVIRRPCKVDGRATNVTLTPAGLKITKAAQEEVFAFVESAFFDGLSDEETKTLADVFTRLLRRQG